MDSFTVGRAKHSLRSFFSAPKPATAYALNVGRHCLRTQLQMKRLTLISITIFLVGQLSSCNENVESKYKTYDELLTSGYLENGWIPKSIPTDSKDIREIHNMDINRVYGRFEFEKQIRTDTITRQIRIEEIISEIKNINSPTRPSWFPDDDELLQMGTINFRQDDFYILVNIKAKTGYFIIFRR